LDTHGTRNASSRKICKNLPVSSLEPMTGHVKTAYIGVLQSLRDLEASVRESTDAGLH